MARNVQKLVMYDPRSVVRLQTKIPPAMISLVRIKIIAATKICKPLWNYLLEYRSPK